MAGEFTGLASRVIAQGFNERAEQRAIDQQRAAENSRMAQVIGAGVKKLGAGLTDSIDQRMSDDERFSLTTQASELTDDPSLVKSADLARRMESLQKKNAAGGLIDQEMNANRATIKELNSEFKKSTPTKREVQRRIQRGKEDREFKLKQDTLDRRPKGNKLPKKDKSSAGRFHKEMIGDASEFTTLPFHTQLVKKTLAGIGDLVDTSGEDNGNIARGILKGKLQTVNRLFGELSAGDIIKRTKNEINKGANLVNQAINKNPGTPETMGMALTYILLNRELLDPEKNKLALSTRFADEVLFKSRIPEEVKFADQRIGVLATRDGFINSAKKIMDADPERFNSDAISKTAKKALGPIMRTLELSVPGSGIFSTTGEFNDQVLLDDDNIINKLYISPLLKARPKLIESDIASGKGNYPLMLSLLVMNGTLDRNDIINQSTPEVKKKVAKAILPMLDKEDTDVSFIKSGKERVAKEENQAIRKIRVALVAIDERIIALNKRINEPGGEFRKQQVKQLKIKRKELKREIKRL